MFTGSKSSTMNKRLLPLRLYHFCVELAKKFDYKCIYDTVKKTNMYDNHTFILHGKKVVPTSIYDGIWIDPDSTCYHKGEDCDFWFSINGYVFVIVEVNNRFYIPKLAYDNDDWKEINNEELEDFAIDIINEKHLVRGYYIESLDFFIEQKLDDDIIYCGCWKGNTEEFKNRINETYPDDGEYRTQYLAVLQLIESLKAK